MTHISDSAVDALKGAVRAGHAHPNALAEFGAEVDEHQGDEHQGDKTDARKFAAHIAGLVLEGLEGSVVPSEIPREVGEEIATFTRGNAYFYEQFAPLGTWGIRFLVKFMPDGSMQVDLRTAQDYSFWRGTFRPVGGPCEARARW